jgi:hypothetical protein
LAAIGLASRGWAEQTGGKPLQKGQKTGISEIAITAQIALSGMPTRMKSVNR